MRDSELDVDITIVEGKGHLGQKPGELYVLWHANGKENGVSTPKSSVLELGVIEITYPRGSDHCIEPAIIENSGQRSERRGEKANGEVMAPRHGVPEHAFCMLAHDVLNKVSAIIGFCDLLETDGTETEKQLHLNRVRVTAFLIADMLNERSCSVVVYSGNEEEPVLLPKKKRVESVEPQVFPKSSASYVTI